MLRPCFQVMSVLHMGAVGWFTIDARRNKAYEPLCSFDLELALLREREEVLLA